MRTHNDWRALAKAERQGHEKTGTTLRLFAEEFGVASPATVPEVLDKAADLKRLGALARELGVNAGVQEKIADLAGRTEKVQAAEAALARREKLFDEYVAAESAKLAVAKESQESKLGALTDRATAELAAREKRFVDAVRSAFADGGMS
jgi:hypothetical protein